MYNILFGGRRKKFEVNSAETTYKVHYLGNVMTSLLKVGTTTGGVNEFTSSIGRKPSQRTTEDETTSSNSHNDDHFDLVALGDEPLELSCVDKPVRILWENHLKNSGQAGIKMKLTLTKAGLRVTTKDHGVTEYFGHRIHLVTAHHSHPKLLVWVYQHVGRTLKTEIRCHAALCHRAHDAQHIERQLRAKLRECLLEYKREKRRLQNSRLCNTRNHGVLEEQLGAKKKHLRTLTRNYKPPVQHGMCAAPRLDDVVEEDEDGGAESTTTVVMMTSEEINAIVRTVNTSGHDSETEMASESSENQVDGEDEYDDVDEDDDDNDDEYNIDHCESNYLDEIKS